ncbi:hypothetical protein [Stenotrophomonas maltophilia]|uniref:hypothetical protein n=1 Tax=Stenotrophomonas maltophilia TaxID=40324 RepID=UPI001F3CEAEB|nr:hypothetical protein [Stenotrophomonas maltophilia]MCF3551611.1 hypothetical protein [Stenotrophomonas maltophilia]MCF3559743.1 hypothetical protein [Stenotrophomonas maltophilia]MCF3563133.1 hypothetical protein [Stenotrophomonas maltophilia]
MQTRKVQALASNSDPTCCGLLNPAMYLSLARSSTRCRTASNATGLFWLGMPSLFLLTPTDSLDRSLAAAAPLNAGTEMPFQFQAKPYSSLDPISETEIPRPRIGPTALADGRHGTEYQFAIYRGDSRVGGVGFDGWDETTQDEGRLVHCFVFDLRHAQVIHAMLAYKQTLGSVDDDFTYIQGLAQGFVLSFAGRTDNDEPLRYLAVTSPQALTESHVSVPAIVFGRADGSTVLASVDVPASGDEIHMP